MREIGTQQLGKVSGGEYKSPGRKRIEAFYAKQQQQQQASLNSALGQISIAAALKRASQITVKTKP